MIPISDNPEERRRSFPVVTLLLIAVNLIIFIYELALGPVLPGFIQSLGIVPLEITTGRDLPPPSPVPVYLTLFTSMFLHGGFLHIAGNMLFLWVFGDNVEDAMGHLAYTAFYLFCGVAAGLAQVLLDPLSRTPGIGASGAIAGVMAAYVLLFPNATIRTLLFIGPFITFARVSALLMIGIWMVFQLISGLLELGATTSQQSGVAFWAHIGGFVAGLIVVAVWRALGREQMANSE